MSKNKQNINCEVHTCKYCNSDENHCDLREIEIKNQCGLAETDKDTICASYKILDEKEED